MNVKIAIAPLNNSNNVFYTFDKLQNLNLFLHRSLAYINKKIRNNNRKLGGLLITNTEGIKFKVIACEYGKENFNKGFDYHNEHCLKLGSVFVLYDDKVKKRYVFRNNVDCDKFLGRYRGYITSECKKKYRLSVTSKDNLHHYRILEYKMKKKPALPKKMLAKKSIIAYTPEEISAKKKERREEITRLLALIDMKFGNISIASDKNAPEFKRLQKLERKADWKDE